MNLLRWIRRILKRQTKFRIFNNQEMAVEAFRHDGTVYYHFADSFKTPAGRAMMALAIYEELKMRCTAEYLEKHIKAVEILLSNPKKIEIGAVWQLHQNLKERMGLVPFPDHIYKLASVTFFDATESPYSYDFDYNRKKIERWKKDPEMLDFFLRTQFSDLIQFGNMSAANAKTYFQVAEQVNQLHHKFLSEQLSKGT